MIPLVKRAVVEVATSLAAQKQATEDAMRAAAAAAASGDADALAAAQQAEEDAEAKARAAAKAAAATKAKQDEMAGLADEKRAAVEVTIGGKPDRWGPQRRVAIWCILLTTLLRSTVASENTCQYAVDQACDEPTYCTPGTDCTDCGTCGGYDTCQYSNDQACDEPTYCSTGTDCTDCGYTCQTSSSTTSGARGLLMEFYDSTGGPRWVNNNGWNSTSDICEGWHGVYCQNGNLFKL